MAANEKQVGGSHYKDMAVEPWDVIDTWPFEQRIGAYRAGALKYLMRMGSKDKELQEVKKAGHYVEKLIEVMEFGTITGRVPHVKSVEHYPPRNMSKSLEEAYEHIYKGEVA